jgi:hypothetical protein
MVVNKDMKVEVVLKVCPSLSSMLDVVPKHDHSDLSITTTFSVSHSIPCVWVCVHPYLVEKESDSGFGATSGESVLKYLTGE